MNKYAENIDKDLEHYDSLFGGPKPSTPVLSGSPSLTPPVTDEQDDKDFEYYDSLFGSPKPSTPKDSSFVENWQDASFSENYKPEEDPDFWDKSVNAFGQIADAYNLSQESTDLDIEASFLGLDPTIENEDLISGALELGKRKEAIARRQQALRSLDEDTFSVGGFKNLLLDVAGIAGPLVDSTIRGATFGGVTAGVGSVAPVVGNIAGFGTGFMAGNASYWMQQGMGDNLIKMIQEGRDPTTARVTAMAGGSVYGALGALRFNILTNVAGRVPAINKVLQSRTADAILNFTDKIQNKKLRTGAQYSATLTSELGQEIAQEVIQKATRDVATLNDTGEWVGTTEEYTDIALQTLDMALAMGVIVGSTMTTGRGLAYADEKLGVTQQGKEAKKINREQANALGDFVDGINTETEQKLGLTPDMSRGEKIRALKNNLQGVTSVIDEAFASPSAKYDSSLITEEPITTDEYNELVRSGEVEAPPTTIVEEGSVESYAPPPAITGTTPVTKQDKIALRKKFESIVEDDTGKKFPPEVIDRYIASLDVGGKEAFNRFMRGLDEQANILRVRVKQWDEARESFIRAEGEVEFTSDLLDGSGKETGAKVEVTQRPDGMWQSTIIESDNTVRDPIVSASFENTVSTLQYITDPELGSLIVNQENIDITSEEALAVPTERPAKPNPNTKRIHRWVSKEQGEDKKLTPNRMSKGGVSEEVEGARIGEEVSGAKFLQEELDRAVQAQQDGDLETVTAIRKEIDAKVKRGELSEELRKEAENKIYFPSDRPEEARAEGVQASLERTYNEREPRPIQIGDSPRLSDEDKGTRNVRDTDVVRNQRASGHVSLIGSTVKDVETLGRAFEPLRNESSEWTYLVLRDKDTGQILSVDGHSFKLVGTTKGARAIAEEKRGNFRFREIMRQRIERLKAREGVKNIVVDVVHNHPSGNAEPSNPDIQATKEFAELFNPIKGLTFSGHTIVDTGEATSISPDGMKWRMYDIYTDEEIANNKTGTRREGVRARRAEARRTDPLYGQYRKNELIESLFKGDAKARKTGQWQKQGDKDLDNAAVGSFLKNDEGKLALAIIIDANSNVKAAIPFDVNMIKDETQFKRWAKNRRLENGGRRLIVYYGSLDNKPQLSKEEFNSLGNLKKLINEKNNQAIYTAVYMASDEQGQEIRVDFREELARGMAKRGVDSSTIEKASDPQERVFTDEGRVIEGALEETTLIDPDPRSQITANRSTDPTYSKANAVLNRKTPEGKALDYGAGLGRSADLGYDTFEPFPKGDFVPDYTDPSAIASNSYEKITSLNVLNVLTKNARDQAVQEIGRILKTNGQALITTRKIKGDVLDDGGKIRDKQRQGPEKGSAITSTGTFQKGFEQAELESYIKEILGDQFTVERPKRSDISASHVLVTKISDTVSRLDEPQRQRNFNRWFEGSSMVDEQGNPLIVYHGTQDSFDEFGEIKLGSDGIGRRDQGELGYHVGSQGQANWMSTMADPERSGEARQVMPLYANIKNPLRLQDGIRFTNENVMSNILAGNTDIDPDQAQEAFNRYGVTDLDRNKSFEANDRIQLTRLQDALRDLGYDGVVYLNRYEGITDATTGNMVSQDVVDAQRNFFEQATDQEFLQRFNAEDSYIVFEPTQLKSATGNIGTFDPEDPSVLREEVSPLEIEKLYLFPEDKPYGNPDIKSVNAKASPKTGGQQSKNSEQILTTYTDVVKNPELWKGMIATTVGSGKKIILPPTQIMEWANNPSVLADFIDVRLTEQMRKLANEGLDYSKQRQKLYHSGEMTVFDTIHHGMWNVLSAGLSPYGHESTYLDTLPEDRLERLYDIFERVLDREQSLEQKGKILRDPKNKNEPSDEIANYIDSIILEGSPSAQGKKNLNSFFKNYLFKVTSPIEEGVWKRGSDLNPDNKLPIELMHDWLSDPNLTGREIRKRYWQAFPEDHGMQNKLVSFMLLTSGHFDVMVLDRVQTRNIYGGPEWQIKLFEDYGVKEGAVDPYDELNKYLSGLRGHTIYSAIEQGFAPAVQEAFSMLGRPEEGTMGHAHWYLYSIAGQMAVPHRSLKASVSLGGGQTASQALEGVGVRQGKFVASDVGLVYRPLPDGQLRFAIEIDDEIFVMDRKGKEKFINTISDKNKGSFLQTFGGKKFNISEKRFNKDGQQISWIEYLKQQNPEAGEAFKKAVSLNSLRTIPKFEETQTNTAEGLTTTDLQEEVSPLDDGRTIDLGSNQGLMQLDPLFRSKVLDMGEVNEYGEVVLNEEENIDDSANSMEANVINFRNNMIDYVNKKVQGKKIKVSAAIDLLSKQDAGLKKDQVYDTNILGILKSAYQKNDSISKKELIEIIQRETPTIEEFRRSYEKQVAMEDNDSYLNYIMGGTEDIFGPEPYTILSLTVPNHNSYSFLGEGHTGGLRQQQVEEETNTLGHIRLTTRVGIGKDDKGYGENISELGSGAWKLITFGDEPAQSDVHQTVLKNRSNIAKGMAEIITNQIDFIEYNLDVDSEMYFDLDENGKIIWNEESAKKFDDRIDQYMSVTDMTESGSQDETNITRQPMRGNFWSRVSDEFKQDVKEYLNIKMGNPQLKLDSDETRPTKERIIRDYANSLVPDEYGYTTGRSGIESMILNDQQLGDDLPNTLPDLISLIKAKEQEVDDEIIAISDMALKKSDTWRTQISDEGLGYKRAKATQYQNVINTSLYNKIKQSVEDGDIDLAPNDAEVFVDKFYGENIPKAKKRFDIATKIGSAEQHTVGIKITNNSFTETPSFGPKLGNLKEDFELATEALRLLSVPTEYSKGKAKEFIRENAHVFSGFMDTQADLKPQLKKFLINTLNEPSFNLASMMNDKNEIQSFKDDVVNVFGEEETNWTTEKIVDKLFSGIEQERNTSPWVNFLNRAIFYRQAKDVAFDNAILQAIGAYHFNRLPSGIEAEQQYSADQILKLHKEEKLDLMYSPDREFNNVLYGGSLDSWMFDDNREMLKEIKEGIDLKLVLFNKLNGGQSIATLAKGPLQFDYDDPSIQSFVEMLEQGHKNFEKQAEEVANKQIGIDAIHDKYRTVNDALNRNLQDKALDQAIKGKNMRVADAPFRKSWVDLFFKRGLAEAVAEGSDYYAWPMTKEQVMDVENWSESQAKGQGAVIERITVGLPRYATKYMKRIDKNAKLQKIKVKAKKTADVYSNINYEEVWAVPITDKVREHVEERGQDLYEETTPLDDSEALKKYDRKIAEREGEKLAEQLLEDLFGVATQEVSNVPDVAPETDAEAETETTPTTTTPDPRRRVRGAVETLDREERINVEGEENRTYLPITNMETKTAVEALFKQEGGIEKAKKDFNKSAGDDVEPSAYITGLGIGLHAHYEGLARTLSKQGRDKEAEIERQNAIEVADVLTKRLTKAGQATQAMRIVSHLNPDTVMLWIDRKILDLNERFGLIAKDKETGKTKDVKGKKKVKISEAERERIQNLAKRSEELRGLGLGGAKLNEAIDLLLEGKPLSSEHLNSIRQFKEDVKTIYPVDEKVELDTEGEGVGKTGRPLKIGWVKVLNRNIKNKVPEAERILKEAGMINIGIPAEQIKALMILGSNAMVDGAADFSQWKNKIQLKVQNLNLSEKDLHKLYNMTKDQYGEEKKEARRQTAAIINIESFLEKYGTETQEDIARFVGMVREVQNKSEQDQIQIGAEIDHFIRRLEPRQFRDYFGTILQTSRLFGIRTVMRNIIGNQLLWNTEQLATALSVAQDAVVSKATGRPRTIVGEDGLFNPVRWITDWPALRYLGEGVKSGWEGTAPQRAPVQGDLQQGKTFDPLSATYQQGGLFTKGAYKAFGAMEGLVSAFLRGTDYAAYMRAYETSLDMQANLAIENQGITFDTKEQRMAWKENWKRLADDRIQEICDGKARYVTFQDDTFLSERATSLKRWMNFDVNNFGKFKTGKGTRGSDAEQGKRVASGDDLFGKASGIIGEVVLPFARVPANLINRGLAYSPAGFSKSMWEIKKSISAFRRGEQQENFEQQANALMSFNRAIIGSGVGAATLHLIALGLLSGGEDDDPRAEELKRQNLGKGRYRVNLSGIYRYIESGFDENAIKTDPDKDTIITWDWAQPLAFSVAFWTNYFESQAIQERRADTKGGQGIDPETGEETETFKFFESLGDKLNYNEETGRSFTADVYSAFEGVEGGFRVALEQPMLKGLKDIFGGYSTQTETAEINNIVRIFSGIPASFIPQILNNVRQYKDPYARDPYVRDPWRTILNRGMNRLPFLSERLPLAYQTLGVDKPKKIFAQGEGTLFNAFINPAFVSQYNPDPLALTLLESYEQTGARGVLPRKQGQTIKILGKTFPLSTKDKSNLQRISAYSLSKLLTEYMPDIEANKEIYTPDEQTNLLVSLVNLSALKAKMWFVDKKIDARLSDRDKKDKKFMEQLELYKENAEIYIENWELSKGIPTIR